MNESKRVTMYCTDDEAAILDAVAKRLNLSRSGVMRNLLLYHGLCGGDMPLTTKILNLPDASRDKVIGEIRGRAENYDPATPQKWREELRQAFGSADSVSQEKGSNLILERLLGIAPNERPKAA